MNNSKKRELYFLLMMLCLYGVYFFIFEVDFYHIKINSLLRIILCVISFIFLLLINHLFNKLGKELISGEEIECNIQNVNSFIKNNYVLVNSNKKVNLSLLIYKGIQRPDKSALIVIKTDKISYKLKQEIYDMIDWYKSTYLKKRFPFIGRNYELKIICFCEDYSISSLSDVVSKVYLTKARGWYDGIVIPVFISKLKEKMYISGFKYIRKYEIDYYSLEKNKLIKLLNDNNGKKSLRK